MLLRRLCYWKGLKASVNRYINQCLTFQKRNLQIVKNAQLHLTTPEVVIVYLHEYNGPHISLEQMVIIMF